MSAGKPRGLGRVYQPRWRTRTGDWQSSPTWWIEFHAYDPKQARRHKYRESAHTTKKSDAIKRLKKRLGEVAQGIPVAPVFTREFLLRVLQTGLIGAHILWDLPFTVFMWGYAATFMVTTLLLLFDLWFASGREISSWFA